MQCICNSTLTFFHILFKYPGQVQPKTLSDFPSTTQITIFNSASMHHGYFQCSRAISSAPACPIPILTILCVEHTFQIPTSIRHINYQALQYRPWSADLQDICSWLNIFDIMIILLLHTMPYPIHTRGNTLHNPITAPHRHSGITYQHSHRITDTNKQRSHLASFHRNCCCGVLDILAPLHYHERTEGNKSLLGQSQPRHIIPHRFHGISSQSTNRHVGDQSSPLSQLSN